MKKLITNYTFNKTAKTITLPDYATITLESLLLITNVTDGIIIYNFADPATGATVATNVITLEYDTSAMDNSDKLQIYYDDPAYQPTPAKPEDSAHVTGDYGYPVLGIRSDNDTATADDGDYTVLKLDEQGRLKVSSKPASYPDITGNITAIQATIGTPVAGGTVEGDVSRASNVMALCSGTFSTINCTFEGSLEASGDTNWFGIQAIRTNANTIETATGNLSAQPVYGWEMSVNALKRVRVRATARTSGTQAWRFVQGTYATEPIPGAQISGTQPVSGTVTATVTAGTVNPVVPATPYFVNSAANTNGALILTGTSGLQAFYATNEGASVAYVKLYNKATAPTVGTDVPEMTIPVPAAASGVPGVATIPMGFHGFRFALGLGIAITGAAIHTDTTAVAAGQVKVKLSRTV